MKKTLFFIIISFLCFQESLLQAYPYGPPHRFNQNQARSRYFLAGINFWNFVSSANNKIYLSEGRNQLPAYSDFELVEGNYQTNIEIFSQPCRLMAGTFYGLLDRPCSGITPGREDAMCTNDKIVFYLYNRATNKGEKVIFDVDKFEKYMTLSWKYNDLSSPKWQYPFNSEGEYMPDVGGFQLVFGITSNAQRAQPAVQDMRYLSRECTTENCNEYYYKIFGLTGWRNKSENSFLRMQDLYDQKIITSSPLTQEDIDHILLYF